MKISSSLLKPTIDLLQQEFRKLKGRTGFGNNEESLKLRSFIDRQMEELEKLVASVSVLDQAKETRVPGQVYTTLKKAKHSLRISNRTWSRIVSNEARIRKMQERRKDVATFAA